MNIGSFIASEKETFGIVFDDYVQSVTDDFKNKYNSLREVVEKKILPLMYENALKNSKLKHSQIKFLPPILNPTKIICIGMNYRKPYPIDGKNISNPKNIILFGKNSEAMLAHLDSLEIPFGDAADTFDYEGEIAVVIGTTARNVSVSNANNFILGFSALNDGSVRDWQSHSIHAGKNFSGSGSWGPWITPVEDLIDPSDLELTVCLNGKVVQNASMKDMIFSIQEQISYISSIMTLNPGDVIATGSPNGTGASFSPKRYLRAGDELEIHVSNVGSLKNFV